MSTIAAHSERPDKNDFELRPGGVRVGWKTLAAAVGFLCWAGWVAQVQVGRLAALEKAEETRRAEAQHNAEFRERVVEDLSQIKGRLGIARGVGESH